MGDDTELRRDRIIEIELAIIIVLLLAGFLQDDDSENEDGNEE